MKQNEKDEQFAGHIPGVLQYHHLMLGDSVRNGLLAKAIEQSVSPETRFLDIGAGTGVWAILAAKLGAKRVVAVEVEECLIPIIYKHAQENGVADMVEIIHGRSDDTKIRGKFDVIVSELFGGDAFGAATVNSFIDIRKRFLARNGILIPQKLTMMAVPARIETPQVPTGLSLKTDFLSAVRLNYSQSRGHADKSKVTFLGEPKPLVELELNLINEPHPLSNLTASWQMDDLSQANGFATYNRSVFIDGIELDSRDSQSWGLATYEFMPFEKQSGELKLSLTIEAKTGNWSVSVPSNPEARTQTFSPVFGFTRIRMAQKMTPNRKFHSPKSALSKKKK